jgi:hypothetical protein
LDLASWIGNYMTALRRTGRLLNDCSRADSLFSPLGFHVHGRILFLEGTPIGILGFPQGLSFPAKFESKDSLQMTPLLQTGVISGMLPFSGLPKPTSFVLDILINSGSSGSPLFLENGDVVGVVYAARQRFELLQTINELGELESSENSGVYLPTSLGLAVPSARFPENWLSKKA